MILCTSGLDRSPHIGQSWPKIAVLVRAFSIAQHPKEFEAERVLIIISYGFMNIEKRGVNYMLHVLFELGLAVVFSSPCLGKGLSALQ